MMDIFARESQQLRGSLPAVKGPTIPSPERWSDLPAHQKASAAVAVLFIPPGPAEQVCRLVLTRRSIEVASHKGQIAFAGGRCDPQDLGPKDTAAREVEEEIGIERARLKTHAALPCQTSIDGSTVYPFLMTADVTESDFAVNGQEVAELILSPWTEFSYDKHSVFSYNLFGLKRSSYLFVAQTHNVWGLTAKILAKASFS